MTTQLIANQKQSWDWISEPNLDFVKRHHSEQPRAKHDDV